MIRMLYYSQAIYCTYAVMDHNSILFMPQKNGKQLKKERNYFFLGETERERRRQKICIQFFKVLFF